jgi:hypothetical protein
MQLDDSSFCWELVSGDAIPRGRSLRYTLMVELGLRRAGAAGHAHDFDFDAIGRAALGGLDDPELKTGDLGLYLWADARAGRDDGAALLSRLDARLAQEPLETLEGQQLAWIVIGSALRSAPVAKPAVEALLANQEPSGLLRHRGGESRRARFPNFATQIYGVLALATAAKQEVDERALPAARRAADRLIELQLADGGWPWLFDAQRGRVVERYEVYSVHQHAMAPMGLLELHELTGDDGYRRAAVEGLPWIHGQNELGEDMVERDEEMILRSIRRRPGFDRVALYAKTALATAGIGTDRPGTFLELNRTCRPYELGWLLEGWAGREALAR